MRDGIQPVRRQHEVSYNLVPEVIVAIEHAVENAMRNSRSSVILPRRMTEHDAAAYVGRSFYWLRNFRKADDERVLNGGEREGPAYVREGKSPMYYREDLDRWLDGLKEAAR